MGAVNGDSAATPYIAALQVWPLQLEQASLPQLYQNKVFLKIKHCRDGNKTGGKRVASVVVGVGHNKKF